jgi:hypothetical protein
MRILCARIVLTSMKFPWENIERLYLQVNPGRHSLNRSDFLVFEDVPEVHVIGVTNSAEIVCADNSAIVFLSVSTVVMANLTVLECGGIFDASSVYGISAIALYWVSDFTLDNIHLYNSTATGVVIRNSYGIAKIQDSVISGSPIANIVCVWDSLKSENVTSINFTVKNSTIKHGGSLLLDMRDTTQLSGGMNILLNEVDTTASIYLDEVTLYSNSGVRGGNLYIMVSTCAHIFIVDSSISHGMAYSGGGLAFSGGKKCDSYRETCYHILDLVRTAIVSNNAITRGGGVSVLADDHATINMHNVTLQTNTVLKTSIHYSKTYAGGGLDFCFTRCSQYRKRDVPVLTIDRCVFRSNFAHTGAGLYFTTSTSAHSDNCTLVTITSSVFEKNEAQVGAGAVLILDAFCAETLNLISISSSRFEDNTATSQASGILVAGAENANALGVQLESLYFVRNQISVPYTDEVPSTVLSLSIAELLMLNCTFHLNRGSAIGAVHSRMRILGFLNVSHNSAAVGSGMNLISSFLEIDDASFIIFEQNSAEVGGAIYTNNRENCFFTFYGDMDSQIFYFFNNLATIAGDVLYERVRSNCTLSNSGLKSSSFHRISTIISQGKVVVASDPYKVCICYENIIRDCERSVLPFSVIRGELLSFSVALADENSLPAPGYLSITNAKEQHLIHSEWNSGVCSEIAMSVPASEMTIHLHLFAKNYHNSAAGNPVSLVLDILPCPSGFQDSRSGMGCECVPFSKGNGLLQCNVSDLSFTRLPYSWVGGDEEDTIKFFEFCPFNYCEPGAVTLYSLSSNNSAVCTHERSGVLCGKCSGNLSLTLGNSQCKFCSNNFITLIIVFGVLGLLLPVVITLLSLTITRGTINGVIFYAAFLHLNRSSFFPSYDNDNLIVIFISWLNLDFGFNVCFYHGLTSYAKLWLQFVFPMYVYAIEIIVIVTSYQSSKLARITGARNRVKIMCTMFLLGYMKLLRAVLAVFPYAEIRSPYNSREVDMVWLYDGNIEYYSEHHLPLFIVAVSFLLVISVPYTFSLLFVQLLQRLPRLPCKLQCEGISDAHVGPFKEMFRFWLGLLLSFYTFLVLLYNFTGGNEEINLTALIIVCSSLLLLQVLLGGVYKNKVLSILESLFFFNLLILSATYLQVSHSKMGSNKATSYFMISLALVLIWAILIYHVYRSICGSRNEDSRVTNCLTLKLQKMFATSTPYLVLNDEDVPEETEYANVSSVVDDVDDEDSKIMDPVELVPMNWLPTNFPHPVYREHPDLLRSEGEDEAHSCSNSSGKSISELSKVRSSYLVVNRKEEDVSLMEDPKNVLRLQRLSVDAAGNRTYMIEDDIEGECIGEGNGTPTSAITADIAHAIGAPNITERAQESVDTKVTGDIPSPATRQKIPTTSESTEHKKWSSSYRLQKCPPRKRTKSMQCKRPQSGSNCFKCDPKFFLQSKVKVLKVDKNGGVYSIRSHDITLSVPPAAIKDNATLDIEVAVMLNGPFVFPSNIRPISPVLWICSRNKALLCKPIEITLPHFIGALSGDEAKLLGIHFMKASHYVPTLPDGTRRFTFDHIGTNSETSFASLSGRLKTRHFCFLCIVARECRSLYKRASYCLTRVDPIAWNLSRHKQEIYFVLSYYMKTCLKVN